MLTRVELCSGGPVGGRGQTEEVESVKPPMSGIRSWIEAAVAAERIAARVVSWSCILVFVVVDVSGFGYLK